MYTLEQYACRDLGDVQPPPESQYEVQSEKGRVILWTKEHLGMAEVAPHNHNHSYFFFFFFFTLKKNNTQHTYTLIKNECARVLSLSLCSSLFLFFFYFEIRFELFFTIRCRNSSILDASNDRENCRSFVALRVNH